MNYTRRLLWHGMVLFLLGLLTGFAETTFANTRMALAAHLEGVMNGILLIALGAAWTHVVLSPRLRSVTFWLALFSTYANWLFTTLAAALGTVALSPITAAGRSPATRMRETIVLTGFTAVGLATVAATVLLLVAFRSRSRAADAEPTMA